MKKNDIFEITITDMTAGGSGVGRHDGFVIFVPNTAAGDVIRAKIVKVKTSFAYAAAEEILKFSPDRIEPDCPVFGRCGGCGYRHITYEAEIRLKEKLVRDAFNRIGGLSPVFEPVLPCAETLNYRNKAQYPVSNGGGAAVCGFFAKRSNRVVPFTACKIQPEIFEPIVNTVTEYANATGILPYDRVSGRGSLRHIYLRQGRYSGEIMVCLVAAENLLKKSRARVEGLAAKLSEKFPQIKSIIVNINSEDTNVILGQKNITVFGNENITDIMCGNPTVISPNSFYQVNTVQAELLYGIVREYAEIPAQNTDCTVLDLYCGAGTIGLSLARDVRKVIGVEVVPQAVENARLNAKLCGAGNAEFICGDAAEAVKILNGGRGIRIDTVIIDPPRKGCEDGLAENVARLNPKKIIMVSCNPSTAARDAAIFAALGYETRKVRAVDMFPRTAHAECVALLERT